MPTAADSHEIALTRFIDGSPTPFHAVEALAGRLAASGAAPRDAGGEVAPFGFAVRGGSLVAWRFGAGVPRRAVILGAHTDSPNLRIKPRPDRRSVGIAQLGVEVYGGVLLNSWLDRDLGVAGRAVVRDGGAHRERLFASNRPLLRIPQLAIHLDRDVNERGLVLNRQAHLAPMWSHAGDAVGFRSYVASLVGAAEADVVAWDAMLFDTQPAALTGLHREFVSAARIDNLLSCHCAIEALISAPEPDAGTGYIAVLFDHEEVGSTTDRGAAGAFFGNLFESICAGRGADRDAYLALLARSLCISTDCAHATHPNYPERHEPEHLVSLNGGPVIKLNTSARYASESTTIAPFVSACERAGTPYQWFVTRSDLACGSTIGPLTAAQLGIATIDVGVAQLAMHSCREMCGALDVERFTRALAAALPGESPPR